MTLKLIAGKFKGRKLKTPKSSTTRPTQSVLRGAVFNICQNEIEGARFLDLFAGSGAMGLEALSRGASHATFVEQNRHAAQCIEENIETLGIEPQTALLKLDAEKALGILARQESKFEVIYVDPPYDFHFDLLFLIPLLTPQGILFVEERASPKTKKMELPHLELLDSRKYGTARLFIFRKK
jgi:16S rRNA (guanine(966)-N(2))-methyltransferase RsmD